MSEFLTILKVLLLVLSTALAILAARKNELSPRRLLKDLFRHRMLFLIVLSSLTSLMIMGIENYQEKQKALRLTQHLQDIYSKAKESADNQQFILEDLGAVLAEQRDNTRRSAATADSLQSMLRKATTDLQKVALLQGAQSQHLGAITTFLGSVVNDQAEVLAGMKTVEGQIVRAQFPLDQDLALSLTFMVDLSAAVFDPYRDYLGAQVDKYRRRAHGSDKVTFHNLLLEEAFPAVGMRLEDLCPDQEYWVEHFEDYNCPPLDEERVRPLLGFHALFHPREIEVLIFRPGNYERFVRGECEPDLSFWKVVRSPFGFVEYCENVVVGFKHGIMRIEDAHSPDDMIVRDVATFDLRREPFQVSNRSADMISYEDLKGATVFVRLTKPTFVNPGTFERCHGRYNRLLETANYELSGLTLHSPWNSIDIADFRAVEDVPPSSGTIRLSENFAYVAVLGDSLF